MPTIRGLLLALSCYLVIGCTTEPSGHASALGVWRFDASYGGCTISAATLALGPTAWGWLGRLHGGQWRCGGIPGEQPITNGILDAVLENLRVEGDSISFEFNDGYAAVAGRLSAQGMDGVIEVVGPFCQCNSPIITGNWSATRP